MTDCTEEKLIIPDSTLLGKFMFAKSWGGKIYQKAVNSGEQVVKSLTTQVKLKDIKEKVSDVGLIRKFVEAQEQFEFDTITKSNSVEFANYSDSLSNPHLPPWDPYISGLTDPVAVNAYRDQILSLSLQSNNFLIDPPNEAQIRWTTPMPVNLLQEAKTLLEFDPNLRKIRYQLVPRKIQEDVFWRNYFYRLSLVRQSAHLATLSDPVADESGSFETDYICIDKSNFSPKPTGQHNFSSNSSKLDHSSSDRTTKPTSTIEHESKSKYENEGPIAEQSNDFKCAAAASGYSTNSELEDMITREVDELVLNEVEYSATNNSFIDGMDAELEMELLAELEDDSKTGS